MVFIYTINKAVVTIRKRSDAVLALCKRQQQVAVCSTQGPIQTSLRLLNWHYGP
jgi:hypothetical protein